jgi:hypothetical protein
LQEAIETEIEVEIVEEIVIEMIVEVEAEAMIVDHVMEETDPRAVSIADNKAILPVIAPSVIFKYIVARK